MYHIASFALFSSRFQASFIVCTHDFSLSVYADPSYSFVHVFPVTFRSEAHVLQLLS